MAKKNKKPAGKIFKWIGLVALPPLIGLIGLSLFSKFLVREITQEVAVAGVPVEERAEIGEFAPYFELPGLEIKPAKLSDYLGMPLVLTFWTTWNQGAVDQLKILDDLLREDPALGFNILAINSQQDRSAAYTFYSRGGYKVPAVLDESGGVGELYEAFVLPTTFFIDAEGKITDVVTGVITREAILNKL